jgi:acyl-CoA dehydrogenase
MSERAPTWMTDDVVFFRDNARRFFETRFVPREAQWAKQHCIDRDAWNEAGEAGLLCVSIPEAYGGGGGSFAHEAVLCSEQARALVSGFGNNVHSGILAHYLLAYGSDTQKRAWLPKMARGELIGAIAMSEPGAGSDLQGMRTSALRDGDHYVINGAKTFITNGLHAGLVCVAARTDPAAGARGISLIVLETDGLEGFRRGQPMEKLGMQGQDTTELFFDNVRVPLANLLGAEEGQGFMQLMQQLARERLLIAISAVATMQRAVDDTTAYVRSRKAFGKTLFDLQNTRFKLAECSTLAKVACSFVDDCIGRVLDGTLDVPTAAMAKWWTTQVNCEVIDECLQLHGGYGYITEYPIARMYVNARVAKIYGGANEIMKEIVARAL